MGDYVVAHFFVILGGLKVGLRYGYPMKHLAVR